MIQDNWTNLATEPRSILGPYAGNPPPLNSFAPHSWRADFDQIAIAGQFLQLPNKPPQNWLYNGAMRAFALFEFGEVRKFEVSGFLSRSEKDDSLHGVPVGVASECSLTETDDIATSCPNNGLGIKWRRFYLQHHGFSLELEAAYVSVYIGQKAFRQYGWPKIA